MALISVHQVKLSLGGVSIFSGVDLQLERGERVGLLGRNGAGKSTLMRLIAGEIKPDAGDLKLHGSPVIGRLIQEVPAGSTLSAFSMVAAGLGSRGEALGEAFDLGLRLALEPELSDRFEAAQTRVTELGAWGEQAPVEKILSKLGLEAETPFDTLSAGLKRRVLLAQALVREPDVLLLDEPTNHMDLEAIEKLEGTLLRSSQTLLFTTHDREFLERVATRIVELDRGALRSFPGNYSRFLEQRQAFLEAEEKQWATFDKKLAQEEAWIRRGVKARNVRNMGRVRVLQEMRAERAERRERIGKVGMQLQDAERSGALVAKVDKLRFERNGQVLVDQFSTLIMRGDRIGIIGPNGVGKTTLIKILLGELEPTAGEVKLGTNLQVAVFDQLRDQLDEKKSVCDNIDSDGDFVTINGSRRHVMGYLEDFLFSRERARGPIQKLSGGERNRLLLARLFTKPANVLILDEPTNDLDLETLEVLEDLLAEFQGTILIVSHDRAFLNNVVTSTLHLEGGGRINEYVGGYDDALRQGMAARQLEREKEREKDKSRAKAEEKPTGKASKKGLSYKEKRELEELPERIEALEARQAALTAQMAEADFYKRPQSEIAEASAALEAIGPQIETAMARWEELESRGA